MADDLAAGWAGDVLDSVDERRHGSTELIRPYLPVRINIRYAQLRSVADRIIGVALLAAASPVMLIVAAAVVLDSGLPVLFRQERVGQYEIPFSILKFRSMRTTAPKYSDKVAPSDQRITRIGRFIRATCLDELPQLINVVRGEMALIGPRPEQLPLLGEYTLEARQRHQVKPGITGWWQIHHRDNQPLRLDVDKDLYYIANQGIALDIRILAMTCVIVLRAFVGIR